MDIFIIPFSFTGIVISAKNTKFKSYRRYSAIAARDIGIISTADISAL
jgi:hypothetical protein